MKMILEQASNCERSEVVEITTLDQILKLAGKGPVDLPFIYSAGVVITRKSLISQLHNDPDIKWHVTIYDDYIE
jgi:hypothetical protein